MIKAADRSFTRPLVLARLLLGALLLAPAALALAAGPPARAPAEELTLRLADAIRGYHQAPAAQRSARLAALAELAAQRRELLLELLATDPAEARRLVLPPGLGAGLPAGLADRVEQRTELEGELTALFEDPETGPARLRHYLDTPAGERLELHFAELPRGLTSGQQARVRGLRLGSAQADGGTAAQLLVDTDAGGLEVLALDGDGATASAELTPLPDTRGTQRIAVLLINFASQPDYQPWSVEEAQTLVFNHVDAFLRENSGDLTWLEGALWGWLTINYDPATCSTDSITGEFTAKADAAAAAAGVDLSGYRRILYMFPAASCRWSGLGTLGGNPSRAWSNGRNDVLVVGHELGHNLGLWHAHALECGSQVLGEPGAGCTNNEYGDQFDIMGNTGARHFGAFHKAQLGWLDQPDTPQIAEVTASGSYPIAPYISGNGGDPVALKIPRAADPATGAPRWYYLEYREPVGYDSPLAGNANLRDGVLLRSAADSVGDSSFVLDLTPGSSTSSYYDWSDPALVSGASYMDAAAGLGITTLWTAASGATVEVQLAAADCVRAAPSLRLTPAEGQWAAAGSRVEFSLEIQNLDSAACSAADFALSAAAPAGWPAPELAPGLRLAPGTTATLPLGITSAADAPDGIYDIAIRAAQVLDPALAATASATYVVQPAVVPPVAVDDYATTGAGTPVTIPVLANDWDPQGLPLSLVSTTPPAKGEVLINPDGTLTYVPGPRFKGSDSFSYQISSGVAGASALVEVRLARGGRGKPGR
ncbi:MAG: Ig-like domain-containing protein [Pseudomonadota bacterium]